MNTKNQSHPAVAGLTGGGFVTAWEVGPINSFGGPGNNVIGRLFNADGSPAGVEFTIATETGSTNTQNVVVHALSDGGFVALFHMRPNVPPYTADGSGWGTFGQRYAADGAAVGGRFLVNTTTGGSQLHPMVTGLVDGSFVVSWQGNAGIFGQRYDANAVPEGQEFRINNYGDGNRSPWIAPLDNGGFVATWIIPDSLTVNTIHSQTFDAFGSRVGQEKTIATINSAYVVSAPVATLGSGGYVVVWGTNSVSDYIYCQRFDSSGNPLAAAFKVNTGRNNWQDLPTVSSLADGGFMVSWQSYTQGAADRDVYAKRYDAYANPVGTEFLVNTYNTSAQYQQSLAPLADGGFAAVWSSWGEDGQFLSVHGKVYDNNTAPLARDDNAQGEDNKPIIISAASLLANDRDFDGNTLNLTSVGNATHGIVSLNAGNIVFQPATNYVGPASFSYTVSDGKGGSSTSTVDLTINLVNEAPVAHADVLTTKPNTALTISAAILKANDTDADGEALTITSISNAAHGTAVLQANGSVLFTPTANFNGTAGFEYTINDGMGGTSTETAYVVVQSETSALDGIDGGTEIHINSTEGGFRYAPAVAQLKGGGLVAAWYSSSAEYGVTVENMRVFGRYFDASGTPTGPDFVIAEDTHGISLFDLKIAALSDGGFVATFAMGQPAHATNNPGVTPVDTQGLGVYAQRYTASGAPAGGRFRVNTTTSTDQLDASVTALADGGFVSTWISWHSGSTGTILGQRFNALGGRQGTEFQVNTTAGGAPTAAALPTGGFVITWRGQDKILSQIYDAAGTRLGAEVTVDPSTFGGAWRPSVAAIADGGYVISWTRNNSNGDPDLFGRRYDAAGNAVGASFKMNTYTPSNQWVPSITSLADGGFMASWESYTKDGSSVSVAARRFDANANPVGDEFLVNDFTVGNQGHPTVIGLDNGGFAAVWSSQGQDSGVHGIYGKVYSSNFAPLVRDDQVDVDEAANIVIAASTLLANDRDYEGNTLAISAVSNATHGTVRINAAGNVVFTPTLNYDGPASFTYTVADGKGGVSTGSVSLTITSTNDAPIVVHPLADQALQEDALFTYVIPADAFADPDAGDTLNMSATLSNGNSLPAWLSFDPATRTFSGTPRNGHVGTVSVQVTVTDNAGESVSDVFALEIANTNDAPTIAHATADQNATEDAVFSYIVPADAFADVDAGDTLSLSASLPGGIALPSWLSFDAATRTFSGTPQNGDVGALTVRLTATDSAGAKVTDVFVLNVANTNDAPVVAAPVANQSATEDAPFSFTVPAGTFTDVDAGDTLNFVATRSNGNPLPAWLSFDSATRTFSGTPRNGHVGTMSVKLTATDAAGATVSDEFDLEILNTNDAPVLANAIADQATDEDTAFSFTLPADAFADVDAGDSLTLTATLDNGDALPSWLSFDAATRTFSGTPENGDVGAMSVKVTATDLAGTSASDVFALDVVNTNDAPVLANALADQATDEDAAFSFTLPADAFADVDAGDSLTLTATLDNGDALPSWLSFDVATRTFSGTPENGDVGAISVKVTATDLAGTSASDVFALNVLNTNDAPVLANAIADQATDEDAAFSFTIPVDAFVDVDAGDSLILTATLDNGDALPSWLSFDAATRTFSGTPENGDVGAISVKVTATDLAGTSASDVFALEVANTNDAPVLANAISDLATDEDAVFSFTLPADAFADVDAGDSLILTATLDNGDALPSWLSFDVATRTFSGTPENGDVGAISVKVTAIDLAGTSASDVFALSVLNTNDAPVLANAIADQATDEDAAFSFTLPADAFADVDAGDSLTLTATLDNGDALPSWLSFDAATRTFSGTPENGDVGAISVKVTATDLAGTSASDVFALNVLNTNDAPILAMHIVDQLAKQDTPFSLALPAGMFADVDQGDTLTTTVRLSDGAPLPSWLVFDPSTGSISGTPRSGHGGTLNIEVLATDSSGATAHDVFVLEVDAERLVMGTDGNDNLMGSAYVDLMYGLGGNDTLTGLASNDLLDGGTGADSMAGGLGDDTYFVDNTGDVVIEAVNAGYDTVLSSISYSLTANVEKLILTGTANNTGGGNNLDNFLLGNSGNNVLDGGAGNDTLVGGQGADSLYGGFGNDTYRYALGDGLDSVSDTGGTDTVRFGAGISADNISVRIVNVGGQQFAQIRVLDADGNEQAGQGMNFLVSVSNGLVTSPIEHFVFDNGQTVTLDALLVRQTTMQGTNEDDILTGDRNDNTIYGRNRNDLIYGGLGNDTLFGESGVDVLNGGGGNDTLDGGSHADLLYGSGGNDTILGGSGRDWIAGGLGNDIINGDSDRNLFAFNRGDGADVIQNSTNGNDTLSIGKGIRYADMTLTKSGNNLILGLGQSESITLKDWYTSANNKGVGRLQVVTVGGDYDAGSTDKTKNREVEVFDFTKLVQRFDTLRNATPSLNQWSVMTGLLEAHLSGSNTAAIGGDLSYQYATASLAGIGLGVAQEQLSSSSFNGTTAQTLHTRAQLEQGVVRLG